MPSDAKERLTALVSIHVVAKDLDKSVQQLRRWCSVGLAVPRGSIVALRRDGWQIKNRRVRLWSRRVGNDVRTTWEAVDRFLEATGSR